MQSSRVVPITPSGGSIHRERRCNRGWPRVRKRGKTETGRILGLKFIRHLSVVRLDRSPVLIQKGIPRDSGLLELSAPRGHNPVRVEERLRSLQILDIPLSSAWRPYGHNTWHADSCHARQKAPVTSILRGYVLYACKQTLIPTAHSVCFPLTVCIACLFLNA